MLPEIESKDIDDFIESLHPAFGSRFKAFCDCTGAALFCVGPYARHLPGMAGVWLRKAGKGGCMVRNLSPEFLDQLIQNLEDYDAILIAEPVSNFLDEPEVWARLRAIHACKKKLLLCDNSEVARAGNRELYRPVYQLQESHILDIATVPLLGDPRFPGESVEALRVPTVKIGEAVTQPLDEHEKRIIEDLYAGLAYEVIVDLELSRPGGANRVFQVMRDGREADLVKIGPKNLIHREKQNYEYFVNDRGVLGHTPRLLRGPDISGGERCGLLTQLVNWDNYGTSYQTMELVLRSPGFDPTAFTPLLKAISNGLTKLHAHEKHRATVMVERFGGGLFNEQRLRRIGDRLSEFSPALALTGATYEQVERRHRQIEHHSINVFFGHVFGDLNLRNVFVAPPLDGGSEWNLVFIDLAELRKGPVCLDFVELESEIVIRMIAKEWDASAENYRLFRRWMADSLLLLKNPQSLKNPPKNLSIARLLGFIETIRVSALHQIATLKGAGDQHGPGPDERQQYLYGVYFGYLLAASLLDVGKWESALAYAAADAAADLILAQE